jgi:hypothetical protein
MTIIKKESMSFDNKYVSFIEFLNRIGYPINGNDQINLTDKGAYWVHAFKGFFSIDYIDKLWGTSIQKPWP